MSSLPAWLSSYATNRFNWHAYETAGGRVFTRRIGIVEGLFDVDGTDFGGRADLAMDLRVEAKTYLDRQALRNRITLVWSILREKHVLLAARATTPVEFGHTGNACAAEDRLFAFEPSSNLDMMLQRGSEHSVFVEDHYAEIDVDDFYVHTQNSSRCFDASKALAKLFIMPIQESGHGIFGIRLIFVAAHQIVDGLTSARWIASFIDLLNSSVEQLKSTADGLCISSPWSRLPLAQESLYPPIRGNKARQRWSWLLSRILRHTRQQPPSAFQNPLRRKTPLVEARPFEPRYARILNYHQTPPLNSFPLRAVLGPVSTQRLSKICRQARISMGSGCFALVALVMMLFEERRNPHTGALKRLPFVGSFPVNPRPFLQGTPTTGKEDSLMLAFSSGITLPFLPSDLDLEGRLRLLGKQAHRQLRQYQKRPRSLDEEVHLGSKSPTQLLPMLYLDTMDRLRSKNQIQHSRGWDIQGAYPIKVGVGLSTCGVSSVGARDSVLSSGKHDTSRLPQNRDLVADFRTLDTTVRARNGEFLVGVVGEKDHLRFGVSCDGCAIDPDLATQWKAVLESILEPGLQTAAKL